MSEALDGGHVPARVAYISGAGRSGTTMLERLLVERYAGVGLGEVRHVIGAGLIRDWSCGCGERFWACPFWAPVAAQIEWAANSDGRSRAYAGLRSATRLRGLPGHVRGAPLDERAIEFLKLYDAAAVTAGGRLLVDSSKSALYGSMLGRAAVDLRVVHLVRDPRAVVWSWLRPKLWRGDPSNPGATMPQQRVWRVLLDWWVELALAVSVGRWRSTRFISVSYDELCRDPDAVLARIDDALELHPDEAPGAAAHGIMGNPIRFDRAATPIVVDDGWRREFRGLRRWLVTLVALPWLAVDRLVGGSRGRHQLRS